MNVCLFLHSSSSCQEYQSCLCESVHQCISACVCGCAWVRVCVYKCIFVCVRRGSSRSASSVFRDGRLSEPHPDPEFGEHLQHLTCAVATVTQCFDSWWRWNGKMSRNWRRSWSGPGPAERTPEFILSVIRRFLTAIKISHTLRGEGVRCVCLRCPMGRRCDARRWGRDPVLLVSVRHFESTPLLSDVSRNSGGAEPVRLVLRGVARLLPLRCPLLQTYLCSTLHPRRSFQYGFLFLHGVFFFFLSF